MTSRVVRLGVSLEPELLEHLDRWVRQRNSPSRSEALRAIIRKELTRESLEDPESDAVACVALIYRHDRPNVLRRLTAAEHRWGDHIRFSGHAHLKGESCLEVVALVGRRREVVAAAQDLRGVKGIAFGEFTVGSPAVAGGRTGHHHPHSRLAKRQRTASTDS
ncbi:MAG: nickel-responsive transcriptional regulator NikR [Thermoplasmata archaeon]|nr:nickel-responsive transcriptional regulator NikR [Thermoplasmata archaeon]